MPHRLPGQPAVRWKAPARRAGDSEAATGGGAQTPGSRQVEQLQEAFPELKGPPHPQNEGPTGEPAAPAAQRHGGSVHGGHQTSQPPAAQHAEEKQRAARHRGAKGHSLQSPASLLRTGKVQEEWQRQPSPDPQMGLQDEENREEAGKGEATNAICSKKEVKDRRRT